MFLLRAVLNILVSKASPRRPMCFRCLILSLSGTCVFYLFYCLLDLRSGECNVVSMYVCVALSMDLFVLCVYVFGSVWHPRPSLTNYKSCRTHH